jgi:hypothetical protein
MKAYMKRGELRPQVVNNDQFKVNRIINRILLLIIQNFTFQDQIKLNGFVELLILKKRSGVRI